MFKLRRFVLFGLVLCLAGGILSCSSEPDPSGGEAVTDPTHFYEEVREDFLIDADVVAFPGSDTPKVYEGIRLSLTKDQITDFLNANGDPLVEWTSRLDPERATGYTGTTEKDGTFTYCVSNSGLYPSLFEYENSLNEWWGNYHIYAGQQYYDTSSKWVFAHMFMEPKDFDFATAQEAEAAVLELLSGFGLNDLVLNRTLYIDHEILAEITPILQQPEWQPLKGGTNPTKDDWTAADDGYIFEFFPAIDGIPMSYLDILTDTLAYQGSSILVEYQQSGIICLNADGLWAKGDVVEAPEQSISATEALSLARVKLENLRSYDSGTITKVSGEYMYFLDGDRFLLRPVWVVYAAYTLDYLPDSSSLEYVIIDAITGEEI